MSEDYKEGDNKFTGTIDKVTIAVTPPPAEVQKEEERQDAVIDEGDQLNYGRIDMPNGIPIYRNVEEIRDEVL